MARKTINVGYLARVEGEGALRLTIRDGRVDRAELRIFEPPRFFESFLRGRHYAEAPDITSRIAAASSVMSMATGHQVMQRPQPTQPLVPNWSCQVPSLCVSHWR